jgi:hypothetical protein
MRRQGAIEGSGPDRTWRSPADSAGLLVKPDIACRQLDSETPKPGVPVPGRAPDAGGGPFKGKTDPIEPVPAVRRFFGTMTLDPTRVGRDAGRIAEEVISHLVGQVGADVTVKLEISADLPRERLTKSCELSPRTAERSSSTLTALRGSECLLGCLQRR